MRQFFKDHLLSVKSKLIINVILIHAVLMSLVVIDLVQREKNFMRSELSQKGYELSSLLAANASSALLNNDLVALDELLFDMDTIKDHYMIFILDTQGRVRASTKKEYFNKVLDDEDSRHGFSQLLDYHQHTFQHRHENLTDTFHVIEVHGMVIGYVRTLLDERSLSNELHVITTKGIWYILIAIAIGAFLAWLAVKRLTDRLNRVSVAAEKIAKKEFDVELPLVDGDDELSKMIKAFKVMSQSIHEHVEELSQSSTKLKESQENLLEAQKIAHIGSWVLDIASWTMKWSPETYNINKKDPKSYEPTLDSFYLSLSASDVQALQGAITEAITTGEKTEIKTTLNFDDGTFKYVKITGVAQYDEEGNPVSIKGTTQDITKQTLDDMRLKRRDKQLLVQSRLAQMGEMISMIAHQWRQPLSAISATSMSLKLKVMLEAYDLQTREGIEACKANYINGLDEIENYVQSLSLTINDFRNFYKPDKEFSHVSLGKVVDKALSIIKTSLDHSGIELLYQDKAKSAVDIFDRELMQVVLNILKNAQDNFAERKTLHPKITIMTEDTRIQICDNGGGIPLDLMEKIYDPYFSSKNEKNGTGLGLYMSKLIVEDHHKGTLVAENTAEGVCFNIELFTQN